MLFCVSSAVVGAVVVLAGDCVFVAGVDATVQIEYRVPIKKLPFTIGIDCNPFFQFYHPGPEWIDFGVAVRYVFL